MKAVEIKLSNGITAIYLQLPFTLEFRLILQVPVGAAHDPVGKEGLSHILEHAFFCGTESVSEKDFVTSIHAAGGDLSAATTVEETKFEITASAKKPEHFYFICDAVRQILTEPALGPEDRIEREKQVIICERADGIDDVEKNTSRMLARSMCVSQSDFVDIIGTEESILSIKPEDLKTFMKQTYDAGHMKVFACGDMDVNEALAVLEGTLSAVPNLNQDKKPRFKLSCRPTDIRTRRADLLQNHTALMFVDDSPRTLRELIVLHYASIHLEKNILNNLRSRYGCFYRLHFGFHEFDSSTQQLKLFMSTRPEHSETACRGIVESAHKIDDILINEAIQADLDQEIDYYTTPAGTSLLNKVVTAHNFGVPFDTDEIKTIVSSITPEEIRQRAKKILCSLKGIHVQGPEPERAPSLESLMAALPKIEAPSPELAAAPNTAPRLIVQ